MLTSCSINPHGFQAKVGDFGLSREASASARVAGNLYGTITHMAPEVMLLAEAGLVSIFEGAGGGLVREGWGTWEIGLIRPVSMHTSCFPIIAVTAGTTITTAAKANNINPI